MSPVCPGAGRRIGARFVMRGWSGPAAYCPAGCDQLAPVAVEYTYNTEGDVTRAAWTIQPHEQKGKTA